MTKVLIIGLDGANQEILIKGMNNGSLPTLASIAETGDIETLKAPVPPTTPVSMASVLTGRQPHRHGIFSFETDPAEEGHSYVGYNDIRGDTLFDILEAEDKNIISINVPMTSPLPDTVETGVSGFPQRSPALATPDGLDTMLKADGYTIEPDHTVDMEAFTDEVFGLAERRYKIAEDLVEKDWDVFFLMFTGDARLQHFIDDENTIQEFYQAVDDYIGNLQETIDDELVTLIVSDHGFHELDTVFDIGRWLVDNDYLDTDMTDWSKLYGQLDAISVDDTTIAYPGGAYLGNIYMNEEHEEQDEIISQLQDLTHNDEHVFRDIYKTEELYGDCPDGPDIIPVQRRRYNYVVGQDTMFEEDPDEQKAPDRNGVILTDSPSISLSGNTPRSIDVLPTVLDLLGISSNDLDGTSLRDPS